jgi:hypothetical protein
LHSDAHLEIYLSIRNAGSNSYIHVSWLSPLHPKIEEFGRKQVEAVLRSLPDDPIRASRKTTISYSSSSWSVMFIPAGHALGLAEKIFPVMIELWEAWSKAVESHPDPLNILVDSVTRGVPYPDWLSP